MVFSEGGGYKWDEIRRRKLCHCCLGDVEGCDSNLMLAQSEHG